MGDKKTYRSTVSLAVSASREMVLLPSDRLEIASSASERVSSMESSEFGIVLGVAPPAKPLMEDIVASVSKRLGKPKCRRRTEIVALIHLLIPEIEVVG